MIEWSERADSHSIISDYAGKVGREGSGEVGGADALGVDRGLDLGQGLGGDDGVDGEGDQGVAALGVARDLHAGDVDPGVAEDAADGADHAGAVLVEEERE